MSFPESALYRDRRDVWSVDDPDLETVVDAEFVLDDRSAPRPVQGPDGYRQYVRTYRLALPDMTASLDAVVAGEDQAIGLSTITGTHENPFMGVEPSGREVTIRVPVAATVEADRITRLSLPGWEPFARALEREPDDLVWIASGGVVTEPGP